MADVYTIDDLNALTTLTAADEVPVWDSEESGEPTKKITAQNFASSIKTLASLLGTGDVVNNLTSTSTTAPLSANMGKNLYDRFRGVTDTYAVGPTTIELNGCYPAIVNLRGSGGSGVSGLIFVANDANCYGYNLGAGVSVSMNGGNLVVNVPSSSAFGYSILY